MVRLWDVVGGGDKGGILVREGQATKSPETSERLSTGALIEEVKLVGERLQFKRLEGTGPTTGWVSLKVGGKDLCVIHKKEEPPVPDYAPRCLRPAKEISPAFLECPLPPAPVKRQSKKKLEEAASQRLVGDLYGLKFPLTPDELANGEEFGAKWLTKAMHLCGSLSKDNEVVKVVSAKPFEGGGSGPKGIIKVEYENPDETLDTELFVKQPFPLHDDPSGQRFIAEGQLRFGDNWGGELSFYRFMAPHLPFAVPKLYFGDVCRGSTEAILINATIPWPEDNTYPLKREFKPYEILPACGKCEDYFLTNPEDYYFAMFRRLGQFSGLAKAGKVGPEADKIPFLEYTSLNDVNCAPGFPGAEEGVKQFIEEIAPHWFPDNCKTSQYLKKLSVKLPKTQEYQMQIAKFLYSDPLYIGFTHQNGNTDNSFFYKLEDGTIDCGLLDWGSTNRISFATGFIGSTLSASGEMLAEYDERLIQIWLDAYLQEGGPTIDYQEILFRYRLATALSAYGILSGLRNTVMHSGEIIKNTPSIQSDAVRLNFGLKFTTGMICSRIILLALKGDCYWDAIIDLKGRPQPAEPAKPAPKK